MGPPILTGPNGVIPADDIHSREESMETKAVLILFVLGLASVSPAKTLAVLPGSSAAFVVHARRMFTHEVITGIDTAVTGTAEAPDKTGGPVTAHVAIDAAGFKTGNDLRDEHVREALKAATAPSITFDLSALGGFDPAATQPQSLEANGRFSVGGKSVDLSVPVTITAQAGGYRVRGEAMTGFKALDVTPPGIPLVVGVDDPIAVKIDLLLGAK